MSSDEHRSGTGQDEGATRLADALAIMAVRLIRWLRAADGAPGMAGPHASALAAIIHSGGIAPSVLAQLEQVRRPTITRIVDDLESRGLVRRSPHPIDRRGSVLSVTEEGLALWRAGQLRAVAPLVERIVALEPADRELLTRALPLIERLTEPPRISFGVDPD